MASIEKFGEEWFVSCVRKIIEDRTEHKRWSVAVMPLARTPHDKKGARAMQRYARQLHSTLDSLTPWRGKQKRQRLLDNARRLEKEVWGRRG